MRIPFFQRLPVRLAGLILIPSAVALMLLTELNRRAVEQILTEQSAIQSTMAISAVVEGLENVAGSTEQITQFVARQIGATPHNYEDSAKLARDVLLENPNLHGFAIAYEPDTNSPALGCLVHRTNAPSRYITQDLATQDRPYPEQDWYREAILKGRPVWGEPFFDQGGSERNLVRLAIPFYRQRGDERPSGVVAALIQFDWLRRLSNSNEFSDTSQVIVFSRQGRLISYPKSSYVGSETVETLADKLGAPELAKIRQYVVAHRQGYAKYTEGATGRRMHANYKPARTSGWGVIVVYEEAEFLASQTSFRHIAAAYIGSALLVLAVIVIVMTWRALRHLDPLAEAAGEIANKNLDSDIPESTRSDEIGCLTRSFKDMRKALKAQHLERRWAAQGVEHQLKYNNLIIESIGELVFVLTRALNISRINSAVTRRAGYEAADVLRMPLCRILVPTNQTAQQEDPIATALSEAKELHEYAVTLQTKSGAPLTGRVTMVPIFDNNRVVGCVVTFRAKSLTA